MAQKLSGEARSRALARLSGWSELKGRDAISKKFVFADFNPKSFNYTPPAACPGPWAKVVLEASFSINAGRQFDRTANIWIGPTNIYFGTTSEPSRNTAIATTTASAASDLEPSTTAWPAARISAASSRPCRAIHTLCQPSISTAKPRMLALNNS